MICIGDRVLVRKHLGNIPSLLEVSPYNKIVEDSTMFLDSGRSVFRFAGIDVMPLLDEIGGLARIPWDIPGVPYARKPQGYIVPENDGAQEES